MRLTTIEGLPVLNAKKGIKLHVTPCDIKKARIKSPGNCAVAQACKREWKVKEVRVHLGRLYVRTNELNWVRYITPSAMRDEIISYDRGGVFLPAVFDVPAPCPSKRTGKKQSQSPGKNDNTRHLRKKRKPYVLIKGVRISAHK